MITNKEHLKYLQDLLNKQEEPDSAGLKLLFKLYNSEKGCTQIKSLLDERWPQYEWDHSSGINSAKMLKEINAGIQADLYRSASRTKVFYQWTTAVAAVLLVALLASSALFLDVQMKNQEAVAALHEVIAPAGCLKEFTLPDGTAVWLSPGSSLVYSGNLAQDQIRDVRLSGQAYFEVAKKQNHPFVLQLGDVGLKVTGTSFNASGYKDDPNIEVVLKTGEVRLFEGSYADAEKFTLLAPGEMAVYRKGGNGFRIERTNVSQYTSWTGGVLMFRDSHLSEVFKQMERWYNVKILVEDPEINAYLFTATIKKESLESILRLIEYTSNLECKLVENKTYKSVIMVKTKK